MKIKNEILVIPGAPLDGVSPLPKFRERKYPDYAHVETMPEEWLEGVGAEMKVLPYTMQDRYSRKRIPLKLKCLVLENDFLRAEFLPEYGGRLHRLYDKVKKMDLLMTNPVIQPGNLGIRNAWLSGGIEWNIGNLGHTYTTCDNVFTAILDDGEGNDFLRIYEFERLKSIFWQADFHLPEGSDKLIVHVRMINPFADATTTYWWSNVAVKDDGNTRIFASDRKVISFVDGKLDGDVIPNLRALPGVDVSYPSTSPRAFDFFIQPDDLTKDTWEAAAYGDGTVFYERSTPPLSHKKLFCWGNHRAGDHWQDFLSEPGQGRYAEIQAGIAPSQLHDKILPAYGKYEWTQCFGGVVCDKDKLHGVDFDEANEYFRGVIDSEISAAELDTIDKRVAALADTVVLHENIVHNGSGFGALEAMRMMLDGDGVMPKTLCFPKSTIGKKEYPWFYLLERGVLPKEDKKELLSSFMISERWLPRIKNSLALEGGSTWYSLLHYGIAVYEGYDHTKLIADAYSVEEEERRVKVAEYAWKRSLDDERNYWAYRNLAVLEYQRGNIEEAVEYYEKAIAEDGAFFDFGLASEYLGFLADNGMHERLWAVYEILPENCKAADRIKIYAGMAAVKLDKLDYLEKFFAEPHYDIREGEVSLTNIWFEYCARKIARERGITDLSADVLNGLIDEAWDNCPPDPAIDFRMSVDRSQKYRV